MWFFHKSAKLQLCKILISHENKFYDLIIAREEKGDLRHFRHLQASEFVPGKGQNPDQKPGMVEMHKNRFRKRTLSTTHCGKCGKVP